MCACGPCCPGKPNTKKIRIGGQDIGISGFDEIIAKGLELINSSDDDQRNALLAELKVHNYIPGPVEKEYLNAVWEEFKQARAKRLGQVEESYHGISREEIPWYPRVDSEKCNGCGSCVEFCQKKVYVLDDKAVVANPYRCVVSCTGCLIKCPEGALSFPSMVELRDVMKELRKKYGIL